jgi:hypothetical protein
MTIEVLVPFVGKALSQLVSTSIDISSLKSAFDGLFSVEPDHAPAAIPEQTADVPISVPDAAVTGIMRFSAAPTSVAP